MFLVDATVAEMSATIAEEAAKEVATLAAAAIAAASRERKRRALQTIRRALLFFMQKEDERQRKLIRRLTRIRTPFFGETLVESPVDEGLDGGGGVRVTPPLDEEAYAAAKSHKEHMVAVRSEMDRVQAIGRMGGTTKHLSLQVVPLGGLL